MTVSRKTPHRLRHGQAVALQYVAQILINIDRKPQLIRSVLTPEHLKAENAIDATILGCHYTTRIVLPFIVEVALKALIAKHNCDQAEGTHRLCQLYDALPPDLKNALCCDFDELKSSEHPEETRPLRKILADHDNDFPDWRYLDDADNLVSSPVDTLQYVACSVLNVYNSD